MAINSIDDVKVRRGLLYNARAVVSKERIHKSRHKELNALLGRLKELLAEDEVLIIAPNKALKEYTLPSEDKKKVANPNDYFNLGPTRGFYPQLPPDIELRATGNVTATTITAGTITPNQIYRNRTTGTAMVAAELYERLQAMNGENE